MKKVRTKLFETVTRQVKETVKAFDPNAEVILFGSRARGDYKKDSDWDFLILTDKEVDTHYKDLLRDNLFMTELDLTQVISSIIKNKKEWLKLRFTPLFENVAEEGLSV